ncbi:mismatch repair endonuclease PMS2-like [Daphnia carinata]|uniref:mismatch repair endonuclease PMS2-like n=1 Tax=Daphnia carinata TaxID=120202 RepID=UPI00257EE654|nr:mismatch repair endonuclease PMS2-like [Daphnia carinata]
MASLDGGGIIKPIDHTAVHRICSGQVVLTLAVAVKELVENSLDSGASTVEVRLKEYGSDSIEVSDDGSGISPSNFENLCLKHYTSKIEEFEDLLSVQTFGFRGEALSSLCALSTLSVTTCEKSKNIGWKLEYDSHGKLVKQVQYSRQPGTTVSLVNLFSTLPVRHKEFMKNLRREFGKMTNLLTAYCLISKNTRITCTNSTGGRTNTILSTRGGANLKDNFILVFGLKSWQNMLEIKAVRPSEEIVAEFNLDAKVLQNELHDWPFQFEGFVSSCAHGQGRSCADRQYYFMNGRPCDPSKIQKLVNEVYHLYNRNQYPSIVLNIITKSSELDINVTPDKRQLMVVNEKILLAMVKASLYELYCEVPCTFTLQNSSLSNKSFSPSVESGSPSHRLRSSLAAFAASGWKPSPSSSSPGEKRKCSSPTLKQKRLDEFTAHSISPLLKKTKVDVAIPESKTTSYTAVEGTLTFTNVKLLTKGNTSEIMEPDEVNDESILESEKNEDIQIIETTSAEVKVIETLEELECVLEDVLTSSADPKVFSRPKITIPFDLKLLAEKKHPLPDLPNKTTDKRFLARIGPDDAAFAEAELSRQISQSDFEKMEVIGQFNLGFIIAKLNSDLFIVDQHAADEKYNFETLQRATRLQPQKLVCPKPLNLTAANESLLQDNLDIFQRNGFEFIINRDEDSTKRVLLCSVPMSGNWLLGPSDIDELLFMLQDSPVNQEEDRSKVSHASMARYRPSRVRAMFASRACRKAVMVGDSLTSNQMNKLLHQLSELQQPWNCPHGRPTMRHLINTDAVL